MKNMKMIDVQNKKVILRLDLNVTIKDENIIDDTKIRKSIPTIKYLLEQNANILIMSHLGKIKSEEDKLKNSLKIVSDHLEKVLGETVNFVPFTRGTELELAINNNRITLMENTRYEDYPDKLESSCDEELAAYWASLGDVFINDAFGTTHRKHASNAGIGKYLESGYGFLIEEELEGLEPIIKNVAEPFVVIMGGAKVDDKIKLIENLLEECDYLLVGGGIANTFLKAVGKNIGTSLYSADYVDEIKNLYDKYQDKIRIPLDVTLSDGSESVDIREVSDNTSIYDIGQKTITSYTEILKQAKTIFVNGTVGLYEDEKYKNGTISLYEELRKTNAIIVAGGGDAVASVNKLGYEDAFTFLSTGGGATLEYIANKSLKCFEEI